MKWPTEFLGDCTRIVGGATPSTANSTFWDGTIWWATPKDLSTLDGPFIHSTSRRISESGLVSCAAEVLPAGTVLFSSRAPIGHVAINSVPMATNQGFKSLVPDPKLVSPHFLYWWLKANRSHLESLGNGATFKELSKAAVSRIQIPLPPLPEQKRVAAILDQADVIRQKRRMSLKLLSEMYHSSFIEFFGEPTSNSCSHPRHPLGELAEIKLGKMLDKGRFTGVATRPYLRNANVQWFHFDLSEMLEMEFSQKELERFQVRTGDLMICEGGEPGRGAVWNDESAEVYYQKALHRCRPHPNKLLPEYLSHLFYALAQRGGFAESVTSATIAHLTSEKLKLLPIPVPPIELQRRFRMIVAAMEAQEHSLTRHLAQLNSLFASLQHRAFRGEL